MFFKKKQPETATTLEGPKLESLQSEAQETQQPKEKLPAPKQIPELVEKNLVSSWGLDVDTVRTLKIALRKRSEEKKAFDYRIFDPGEAEASNIQIKDYSSLNEHPSLILYEGYFDEKSGQTAIEEKSKGNFDTPLFSEQEIQQKIEALKEPGSSVFFYQARGPAAGGPLSRGAAIIELNPAQKGKKYIIYTDSVVGMQPVGKKQKLFDSDKPKDVARWVKDAHHKRKSHYG